MRKAVDRLVRPIAKPLKAAQIEEDAFLALERFGALPDLDHADVPTVRSALNGSALRAGDVVRAIGTEGKALQEVEGWEGGRGALPGRSRRSHPSFCVSCGWASR